jgi:hypothetical protein
MKIFNKWLVMMNVNLPAKSVSSGLVSTDRASGAWNRSVLAQVSPALVGLVALIIAIALPILLVTMAHGAVAYAIGSVISVLAASASYVLFQAAFRGKELSWDGLRYELKMKYSPWTCDKIQLSSEEAEDYGKPPSLYVSSLPFVKVEDPDNDAELQGSIDKHIEESLLMGQMGIKKEHIPFMKGLGEQGLTVADVLSVWGEGTLQDLKDGLEESLSADTKKLETIKTLLGGAEMRPFLTLTRADVEKLQVVIVSTVEEWELKDRDPYYVLKTNDYLRFGIQHEIVKIKDHKMPSWDDLDNQQGYKISIQRYQDLSSSAHILAHCKGGKGRSGAWVGGYLLSRRLKQPGLQVTGRTTQIERESVSEIVLKSRKKATIKNKQPFLNLVATETIIAKDAAEKRFVVPEDLGVYTIGSDDEEDDELYGLVKGDGK